MQFPRTFRSTRSKLLLLSFCIVTAVPAARADDASHRAKAEEMLRLTKTDTGLRDQLANLQTRIGELSKQQFNLPAPTAEQTTVLTEYQGKIQQMTKEAIGYEQVRPLLVTLYATSFTDAELDGIIAFYKTPVGQSLVEKMPEVATKTSSTVQDRIKELQPKLAAVTQSYAEKLKLGPPAGAAPAPAAPSLNGPKAPARP